MIRRFLLAVLAFAAAIPSFALAQPAPVDPRHEWPFEQSDLKPEEGYRFGRLDNGMRYVIRPNATPKGTALVQFWVDDGSIAETEAERGYAHFIEHMAFKGSTRVPEGEMVKLLEREGLAFGADTNASTNYDATIYRLDLPRNDLSLLDTAIMLMRETASELTFDPGAVEREKGVVQSERRVRDTYALRNYVDSLEFQYPGARFVNRLAIGTQASLDAVTPEALRGLYRRIYRPENTALVVVGDFDPDAIEALVRKHFESWQAVPLVERPDAGPVPFGLAGLTDIHLDPSLAERIGVSRNGPWQGGLDTSARRQDNVLRSIGYAIVNRRMQRLARRDDPPFRGAGLSTAEAFEAGRTTTLTIDAGDGEWKKAMAAAQAEYRRALEQGFTAAEVAEQVANLRTALTNAVAGAVTRGNGSFMGGALSLLGNGQIPTSPQSALARFEAMEAQITPETVLTALKAELVPLDNPLIRFEGRHAPEGGAEALRAAWDAGAGAPLAAEEAAAVKPWGYTRFGPAGRVVSDKVDGPLGIRKVVFANGLMLSMKRTDLEKDRIAVELNLDGGRLLATREDPLAVELDNALPSGGLGKHPLDELQSILAGRSVGFRFAAGDETFVMGSGTTPRDLELQLQLMAAALTDPGFRPQGEAQYRRAIENMFATRTATPENTLGFALGGIISDDDPRFTLQPKQAYLDLTMARLKASIGDRLAHGALELSIVGDVDEARTIALAGQTLGALPAREKAFRPYAENRRRGFTADRTPRVLRHGGAAEQAIVRFDWPTTDDSDFTEELRLELLERVAQIALTERLRTQLGQTYSPGVNAAQSDVYPGFGYFTFAAQVDAGKVDAAREAMLETVRELSAQPVTADLLLRARAPMLEAYDNALKTNGGWMNLVRRAQRKPERVGRFVQGKELLAGLTVADVQATAAKYLKPEERLEIVVLPEGAE